MLKQRPGQSLTDYVHFMRQTFDVYNENCPLIDGSVAIHPHNFGLLMLRGISNTGPFGQAKQCVINAFDTDFMLYVDEVMANILQLAHNVDEETCAPGAPAPDASPPLILAFVTAGRGTHNGRIMVRVLKIKDDACSELETIPLDIRQLHARHHSHSGAFAPVPKFDSDSVFEDAARRQMCARLGFGVQFSAPYAHHMLGKVKRPWRTLRDIAFAMFCLCDCPICVTMIVTTFALVTFHTNRACTVQQAHPA
jgi:hypothetical protein